MKINNFEKIVFAVISVFFITGPFSWAQDIDDIETDMEAVISESEASQSEATDAKRREKEEKSSLVKAKKEAIDTMAQARAKEVSSQKELKATEGRIALTVAERKKHEKSKAQAEKKIVKFQQMVDAKKAKLVEAEAKRDAARGEKEAQEKILATLTDEKNSLESKIAADRDETVKITQQIAELNAKKLALEKNLALLRKNAQQQATKKEKANADRETVKRKVSQVPTKILMRSPKIDCALLEAPSDGARTIGSLKKNSKYELYKIVNRRWVELSANGKVGFADRTCF